MNRPFDAQALHGAVKQLELALRDVELPLALPDVDIARRERTGLIDQLDDYVLPRLSSLDAPLLAVIGGSTGAGKSTLVNSMVEEQVTRSGVLRPTTRASVLIHNPADAKWFTDARVLPGLSRLTGHAAQAGIDDPGSLRLVASPAVPDGLALLDAPDIDSVVSANRDLAQQLLSAADLWLFVTTAARYADAVPWALLDQASRRGTSVAIVLDRVPPEAMVEVRTDLVRMLAEQGLGRAPVFVVPETKLDNHGMLPPDAVERIKSWLHSLAGDARSRQEVIRRTLDGALDSLNGRGTQVLDATEEQAAAVDALSDAVERVFAEHRQDIADGLADGTLMRGEVLARWQEFVGTGELLRQFEAGVGRLRDRAAGVFKARTEKVEPAKNLGMALQNGVAQLVLSHLESAARESLRTWRSMPAGGEIAASNAQLAQVRDRLAPEIERLVRDWQGDMLEMVRAEAGGRRSTARILAFGINGLAVMLMLITFASTYGLSGAEVGIAGGSAVLAQRVLEAVFGDQAVRTLTRRARTMLLKRIDTIVADEQERFDAAIAEAMGAHYSPEAADHLRQALTHVEAAR